MRLPRLSNVIISFTTVLSLACATTTSAQCLGPGPAGEQQALPESVMGYTVEVVPRFEGGCGLIKLERDGGRALGHDPSGEAVGCVAPPSEGDPCTFVDAASPGEGRHSGRSATIHRIAPNVKVTSPT